MSSSTTAVTSAARPATEAGGRMTAVAWLRIALIAGLVAALVTIAFELLVAERVVDHTIALESGREHAPLAVPEPFSRQGQRGGLVLGELLLGCGIALLLAGAATILGTRSRSPLRLWLLMGAAGLVGVVLLPALVYPPLPPGVASGLGIDERQLLYLATIGLGIGGVAAAAHALAASRRRLPLVAACVVVPAAVALLALPDQEAAHTIAPRLLAEFRAVSIASQVLFWATLVATGAVMLLHQQRNPNGAG
jgi:predicted cobalt transporter CbtA